MTFTLTNVSSGPITLETNRCLANPYVLDAETGLEAVGFTCAQIYQAFPLAPGASLQRNLLLRAGIDLQSGKTYRVYMDLDDFVYKTQSEVATITVR